MKHFPFNYVAALIISGTLILGSCKREAEIKKIPFKVLTATWYRISPTAPNPLVIDGVDYISFAYAPGGGAGNATHLGAIKAWFNQLVYAPTNTHFPQVSLVAPVTGIPTLPVLGAPLPLIQAGDFDALPGIISQLQIPMEIDGQIVSSVFYNDKGDAIFLSNVGAGKIIPASATRNDFSGKSLIVGGAGRFLNASGEADYSGYFNPTNPADAGYEVDGWFNY